MIKNEKPMLDIEEQIQHLLSKGVRFELISLTDATAYLREHNNYFKLTAYRKNFPKHPGGPHEGEYINLDFAHLRDLAIIDMRLRYAFIHMALDIEHFAKVKLLQAVEQSDDDGYQIVYDYYDKLTKTDIEKGTHYFDALEKDVSRNRNNPYCGGIIEKYDGCFPVWAFVEIIPLGTMIDFYKFCADKLSRKDMKNDYYLLQTIKELRNAAAHSNCIINDLGKKNARHNPDYKMIQAISSISKTTRDTQLRNESMRQMITLLYAHTVFVTSEGIHEYTKKVLDTLKERILHHIDYYQENENITKAFEFFIKSIDILFS